MLLLIIIQGGILLLGLAIWAGFLIMERVFSRKKTRVGEEVAIQRSITQKGYRIVLEWIFGKIFCSMFLAMLVQIMVFTLFNLSNPTFTSPMDFASLILSCLYVAIIIVLFIVILNPTSDDDPKLAFIYRGLKNPKIFHQLQYTLFLIYSIVLIGLQFFPRASLLINTILLALYLSVVAFYVRFFNLGYKCYQLGALTVNIAIHVILTVLAFDVRKNQISLATSFNLGVAVSLMMLLVILLNSLVIFFKSIEHWVLFFQSKKSDSSSESRTI